jgi:hypothetical protein
MIKENDIVTGAKSSGITEGFVETGKPPVKQLIPAHHAVHTQQP